MDETTIARYQPGGDVYSRLVEKFGVSNANSIAEAARSGDNNAVLNAIANARKDGPVLEESTGAILLDQLETDPFAAPFGAANKVLKNSFVSFLKNPFVVGAVGIGIFFALGGADVLKKHLKNL